MTFDSDFQDLALDDLFAEHGETVTYLPYGGSPRIVTAIVNRNPPAQIPGMEAQNERFLVTFENSASTGLATSELKVQGDAVYFAKRQGGTVVKVPIHRMVGDDGGTTVVECY